MKSSHPDNCSCKKCVKVGTLINAVGLLVRAQIRFLLSPVEFLMSQELALLTIKWRMLTTLLYQDFPEVLVDIDRKNLFKICVDEIVKDEIEEIYRSGEVSDTDKPTLNLALAQKDFYEPPKLTRWQLFKLRLASRPTVAFSCYRNIFLDRIESLARIRLLGRA